MSDRVTDRPEPHAAPPVSREPTRRIRLIGKPANRIRVLVADDHTVYREDIVRALRDSGTTVTARIPT
jgi:PleD family two-component response regulator